MPHMSPRALLFGFLVSAAPSFAIAQEILRIGIIGDAPGLHREFNTGSLTVFSTAFTVRGLTKFDAATRTVCGLCETLPTRENGGVVPAPVPGGGEGERITYKLRPGLRWDDGSPLVAGDFVLAWEVGRTPSGGYAWQSRLADEIVAVSAPDDSTVVVHRRGRSCDPADFRFIPLNPRLEGEAYRRQPDQYARNSLYITAPATPGLSSGPYRLAGGGERRLSMKRNPHWSGPPPAFDQVEIRFEPDAAAMAEAVRRGQVDYVPDMGATSLDVADRLERDGRGALTVHRRDGRPLVLVALNLDDWRLRDARVRRALLLGLDRQRLAAAFSPSAVKADSFLTRHFPYYDKTLKETGVDRAAAGRLLEEAGWRLGADGVRRNAAGDPLLLTLAVSRRHAGSRHLEAKIADWHALGVRVVPTTATGQSGAGAAPAMTLMTWILEAGDKAAYGIFHSGAIPSGPSDLAGRNIFRYRDARADALVDRLRSDCDPASLAATYAGLQRRVMEDLPLLPLFFVPEVHILPPWLEVPEGEDAVLLTPQEVEHWKVRRS